MKEYKTLLSGTETASLIKDRDSLNAKVKNLTNQKVVADEKVKEKDNTIKSLNAQITLLKKSINSANESAAKAKATLKSYQDTEADKKKESSVKKTLAINKKKKKQQLEYHDEKAERDFTRKKSIQQQRLDERTNRATVFAQQQGLGGGMITNNTAGLNPIVNGGQAMAPMNYHQAMMSQQQQQQQMNPQQMMPLVMQMMQMLPLMQQQPQQQPFLTSSVAFPAGHCLSETTATTNKRKKSSSSK